MPWKNLDLTNITGQTIERDHLFNVHLFETIVPYATLEPLRALLPLKRNDANMPTDENATGGINFAELRRRMRVRWETINKLWEDNKGTNNGFRLIDRLDYHRDLSSQLRWQQQPGDRPIRVVYNQSGIPTAALVADNDPIIDYKLFWVTCKTLQEAYYLLGIINSNVLYEAVEPLMSQGQFGARDLEKHLWKLPIPEFNSEQDLHARVAEAGAAAATGVAKQLETLRERRGDSLTVRIARRELRQWLRTAAEGKAVEGTVRQLLKGDCRSLRSE